MLQSALDASDRIASLFIGPELAQVQSVHPPASVLSVAIDSEDLANTLASALPGGSTTSVPTGLVCQPSANFAADAPPASDPRCSNLTLSNYVAGDGLLAAYMHAPPGTGWDTIVQTFTVTEVQAKWAALAATPLASSPHTVALQLDADTEDLPSTCDGVDAAEPGSSAPSLSGLICGLIKRAGPVGGAGTPVDSVDDGSQTSDDNNPVEKALVSVVDTLTG